MDEFQDKNVTTLPTEQVEPNKPSSLKGGLFWVAALLLFADIGLRAIVPFLQVPVTWAWGISAYIFSPLFTCVTIVLVYQLVKFRWRWRVALIVMIGCLLPLLGIILQQQKMILIENQYQTKLEELEFNRFIANQLIDHGRELPFYLNSLPALALILPEVMDEPPPPRIVEKLILELFNKILLLFVLVAAGVLLSFLIREPNLLVPVAPVAAAVDIFTVLNPLGPANQAMQKAPDLLPLVSMTIPQVGIADSAYIPLKQIFAIIGPGDILFLAFFFMCLIKFDLRRKMTLFTMCIVLMTYLQVVLNFGDKRIFDIPLQALPALVPMAFVMLIVNRRGFKLSRDEKILSVFAWVGISGLLIAAFWFAK